MRRASRCFSAVRLSGSNSPRVETGETVFVQNPASTASAPDSQRSESMSSASCSASSELTARYRSVSCPLMMSNRSARARSSVAFSGS
uniref:Uncharacterized protein n=1 Tax=uncultured marine virus TaxID=186617 RepID=A0A0F7LAG5_9VIRU|nr:hypothetical protein [uncultured marine virus]